MAVSTLAPGGGLLNLERELQCFICTELLFQPLTLIDCLHTFCGSCLKEWFNHQYKKAAHSRSSSTSNPYTCPTCRATVKDARHNATVTTLLDMFLSANPTRGRSAEEQAEASQTYKPGEDILPKVEAHRRRDRRGRREEDDAEAQERRLIEEARQRSLRDLDAQNGRLGVPNGSHPNSRSRDHDERRERRRDQDRAERRRRVVAAEETHAREQASQPSRTNVTTNLSPPTLPPRHPESVEARQRDRTIAHQSSLISLMSASESGTGTGDSLSEARIMQEILAEGLLEGINVDELTEQEQDELSERIAEAYRQRHQNRRQPSPPQEAADTNGHPSTAQAVTRLQPETNDGASRHSRSRSHQPSSTENSRARNNSSDSRRPPASRPHLLQVSNDLPASNASTAHRRRASDQTRRQTSLSRPSDRAGNVEPGRPATRSATDLTSHPTPGPSRQDRGARQFSEAIRTNTDAQSAPRASEIWNQGGRGSPKTRPAEQPGPVIPIRSLQTETSSLAPPAENLVATPETATATNLRPHTSDGEPTSTAPSMYAAAPSLQVVTRFEEPSITCARCSRPEIQYDLYKHCSPCKLDLCLKCFRDGSGCNHWYGFGHAAMAKFEASRSSNRATQAVDPPHVLVGRRYHEPPPFTIQAPGIPNRTTTSNPAERLEEGNFCDRCHSFANTCFWSCDYCNDGEWGFCNNCVNTHKCCIHPLLPFTHRSFAPKSPSQPEPGYDPHTGTLALTPADIHAAIILATDQSRPSTANSTVEQTSSHPDYVPLRFTATCDVCHQAIPASESHFHCPSHPSVPNAGDYDICVPCYHNLVKSGRIKRDEGPAGWRKCLSGHRMIIVGFELDEHSDNQRRIIFNDLVGGHKMTEEDMNAWRTKASGSSADSAQSPPPVLSSHSGWAWREDGKKATRSRTATLATSNSKFPPDGGFGKTFVALWSRYPAEGDEGKDEILFPRGAEVCEVEEINEDWKYGVYMGELGFFPAGFVRET